MDISTLIGILLGTGLVYYGVKESSLLSVLLNMHGMVIVIGGTLAALFLNAPLGYVWDTFTSFFAVFGRRSTKPDELVSILVGLSEQSRTNGLLSLNIDEEQEKICGGFLSRAIHVAKEQNNPDFVRAVLEQEMTQTAEHSREIVNLYRTMGVISPMFGLLGTLIGIIQVLQHLANPEVVGPSMALAITSAFYGILLANFLFLPVAGKLRIRTLDEIREKEIIMEGTVEIVKGSIPLVVMRRLLPYVKKMKRGETGGELEFKEAPEGNL